MRMKDLMLGALMLSGVLSLVSCQSKQEPGRLSGAPPLERNSEVSNLYVTSLWDGTPVRVPDELDVEAFLEQEQLPYLWEGEEYKSYIDGQDDSRQISRFHWSSALLFHPDPAMVLETLDVIGNSESASLLRGCALFLVDILAEDNQEIAAEAANLAWMLESSSLEYVFNVLLSKGAFPSGIPIGSANRAIELLRSSCPPSRIDEFNKLLGIAEAPTIELTSELPVLGDYDRNIVCFNESLGSTSDPNARNVAVDDAGRVYVVWHDWRFTDADHPLGKEIFLRYYDGVQWQDELQITDTGAQSTCASIATKGSFAYMVLTEGAYGTPAHMLASDGVSISVSEEYRGFLMFYKLEGAAIIETRPISDSEQAGDADLFVDDAGNVHFVWNDFRHGKWDIYYRMMKADGELLPASRVSLDSDPLIVRGERLLGEGGAPIIGDNVRPSVNVDSTGKVHIVWLKEPVEFEVWAVCHKMKSDSGWGPLTVVDYNRDLLSFPSSCVDASGLLHVSYTRGFTMEDGGYDDKLNYSFYDGLDWSIPEPVYDVPGRYSDAFSSIAADSQGRVHIVWAEAINAADEDLFYASGSSGVFDEVWRITSDTRYSGCPTITVDRDDRVHVAWHDNHTGFSRVCYFEVPIFTAKTPEDEGDD